ncbi:MAG: class I SAM-dependent methyltransferase [Ilumatobacteraceae bacterium]
MTSLFHKKPPPPATTESASVPRAQAPEAGILDQYVRDAPSAQNALDLFKDTWTSSLPPALGLHAGHLPTFDDTRIKALLAHLDSIKAFKVLELGPLEGGHTYMLHEGGARVIAIEGSSRAYLKCLVVKEILNLNRAHFFLGDFVPYLETTHDKFDLVVASGVLYHMLDPIGLLELISHVTDKIAIWTHYWQAEPVEADERIARVFLDPPIETEWRGLPITLHPRHYREALAGTDFCGSPETSALWLERDGLMTVLTQLGFTSITVLEDEPSHDNGPAILLCAER